jgi:carbamoyltransferase
MKAMLNDKIKRRESFRPFAPSVMEEAVAEWFEEDDSVPFMMQVFQVREEKRKLIPAVTHVDGSGRLQTVKRATNPRYHRLIESFRELTGIPMVLNTSFNENELQTGGSLGLLSQDQNGQVSSGQRNHCT